ncbi:MULTISPECIES: ImmA/IrrE family metallo-endopeptidase [Halomonas]|uniref:ImmA/IrrE family metallo-endopeptidase n=1 Tax=Halomonas TaxID=2745 RepID=UPI001C97DF2F|nr:MULTISPECIES: ImmA/IrrE family metallo-endopeptidase [Halomonas]MBY6206900.1 ImmA/IrrE family metallo-endopeptidase [Halomonas sp. DP3Y7-2]MBY6230374.1 ImmA/IrrE family metallo-endopeptidase [Halomonas sp. DP3Y7-1]MCA0918534.1 ImmA/IrrE family metallo-endopeptidase [Halomonas denitrificans]
MTTSTAAKKARRALDLVWDEQLPVNPTEIAHRLIVTKDKHPIKMKGRAGMAYSGQARFDTQLEAFVCEYNLNEVSFRQRFTQAHELGHVILGHVNDGREPKRDTNFEVSTRDPDEIAANRFAAELLMPEDYVRTAVKREFDIKKLARLFDVSTTAMRFRLKNLGILS